MNRGDATRSRIGIGRYSRDSLHSNLSPKPWLRGSEQCKYSAYSPDSQRINLQLFSLCIGVATGAVRAVSAVLAPVVFQSTCAFTRSRSPHDAGPLLLPASRRGHWPVGAGPRCGSEVTALPGRSRGDASRERPTRTTAHRKEAPRLRNLPTDLVQRNHRRLLVRQYEKREEKTDVRT